MSASGRCPARGRRWCGTVSDDAALPLRGGDGGGDLIEVRAVVVAHVRQLEERALAVARMHAGAGEFVRPERLQERGNEVPLPLEEVERVRGGEGLVVRL